MKQRFCQGHGAASSEVHVAPLLATAVEVAVLAQRQWEQLCPFHERLITRCSWVEVDGRAAANGSAAHP